MTWRTVVTEPSELGESPFWHPQEELLYWVDIPARQILRANVFMGTLERWAMPHGAWLHCAGAQRRAGDCLARRHVSRPHVGRRAQLLMRFDHDTATTRFNDGKADPLGRFWAGTMYEPRDRSVAELFSLDCRNAQGGGPPVLERKAGGAIIAQRAGLVARCQNGVLDRHHAPRHLRLGLGRGQQCHDAPARVPAAPGQARRLEDRHAGIRRPARWRSGGYRGQLLQRHVRGRAPAQVRRRR